MFVRHHIKESENYGCDKISLMSYDRDLGQDLTGIKFHGMKAMSSP